MKDYTGVKFERNVKFYKDGEEVTRQEYRDAKKEANGCNTNEKYAKLAVPLYVQCPCGEYVDIFAQESKVQTVAQVETPVEQPAVEVVANPPPPSDIVPPPEIQ